MGVRVTLNRIGRKPCARPCTGNV